MPSVWQMLTGSSKKTATAAPQKIINPLNAKIGCSFRFDLLDWKELMFSCDEIHEVHRRVNKKDHPFVDYMLLSRPLEGDDVEVKLRLMPVMKPTDGLLYDVILLQKHDFLVFNQDFRDLMDEKEFFTQENGVETGQYWRVNDVTGSYSTTVKVIDRTNEKIEGFAQKSIEYWDWWRDFTMDSGVKTLEFLFVEQDKADGTFTLWKGVKLIDPSCVSVY
jgi:hypothetical protein